jgi:hypothetical protein
LETEDHEDSDIVYKQAREIVFKVHGYFMWEVENGGPVYNIVKGKEQTLEACFVGLHTVQWILSKAKGI